MGNNGNCDICDGNQRNQMDMRRQRAAMYDRYSRRQMMPRNQSGCDSCGTERTQSGCDTCGNTRVTNNHDGCGGSSKDELRGMPLAMGFVPWQNFSCTYEPMEGFRAGTIFPELDKPFYGRRGYR